MGTGTMTLAKPPLNKRDGLLAVSVLMLVVLISLYIWSVTMDLRGTIHSSTDLADLDADGDLDVILAQTSWEGEDTSFAGISLWFNQGEGQFTPGDQELPGGFSAAGGDLDGDGDADLLNLDGYRITLSLNQGGAQEGEVGMFKTKNSIPVISDWRGHTDMGGSVILGDLNNDGEVDGIVSGCCYGWIGEKTLAGSDHNPSSHWVWLNKWDARGWMGGSTLDLEEMEGLPMRAAALGDLDGDGDLDVFAAIGTPTLGRSGSPADWILINDGSGNFTDSGQRLGETESTAVALGDLDGDGDLDSFVGTQNGAVGWINQGGLQGGQEGAFAASIPGISGNQTGAVFLSDLDGDSDLDALIAGPRQATIWWNDGQAAFTRSNQRFRYTNRHGLAIGDFNADSWPDIFAGEYTKDYRVWLNQGYGKFQTASWP